MSFPLLFAVVLCLLSLTTALSSALAILSHRSDLLVLSAASCGIGKYDFSNLTSKGDWVGLSPDYSTIYYLNLCSEVKNLWCQMNSNSAHSQVCQTFSANPSITYNLMSTDLSATNWTYINGRDANAGIQFESHTGESCPTTPNRAVIGQLICGNTTGIIAEIQESPLCTYRLTLPTPVLCMGTESINQIATVDPNILQRIEQIQQQQQRKQQQQQQQQQQSALFPSAEQQTTH